MEKHERSCHKNPNRVPYEGELTYSAQTGNVVNFGTDDNLPDGLSWLEWVEHEKMPSYWPGKPGMIYHHGEWHEVPGYQTDVPKGAHGYVGGPPPFDLWPKYGETPLNEFPAIQRWEAMQTILHPEHEVDLIS